MMSDKRNEMIRIIGKMEIGSTFTFDDLATQVFKGDADIIRVRAR